MTSHDDAGRARWADDLQSLTRLEQLLMRYPKLDPAENREVGQLLVQTGPLDMGLLSANQAAWTQAERYRAENPHLFRMSVTKRLGLAALALLTVAIIWWLADIGLP
ncbi:hypothetical protein GGQ97_000012 [Sphingomonas kaistensis]|uniref:Uncharacterized protein n=1 Tax=Sphingomonas kaistensis TaxID=298708 RepID=A0A7X5Y321_9SPHN|nr:hypothetical protein [Sphingomonas kaistensis]NJC04219.1 hypothetical protein [Sphingomonas kaistensis]